MLDDALLQLYEGRDTAAAGPADPFAEGLSIRTIAAAVGVSIGVINKTVTQSIPPPE